MGLSLRKSLLSISGMIGKIIIPKLKYSQYLYKAAVEQQVTDGSVLLDLGCGHHIFPPWCQEAEKSLIEKCSSVIGIDSDHEALTKHLTVSDLVKGNIGNLPFQDETFDLIISDMVMEHVQYPNQIISEIKRVLKPGGKFIFHTPNIYGYDTVIARLLPEFIKAPLASFLHDMDEADVYPTVYAFNSEKEIRIITENAGLLVDKIKYILSTPLTGIIPPLALIELLFLKLLSFRWAKKYRVCLLVTLKKSNI